MPSFLTDLDFWITWTFYTSIVLVEAWGAYREGWLFKWQVLAREPVPKKFLDLWRHMGIQFDFYVVNPTVAYILLRHGNSWDTQRLIQAIIAAALVSLPVVDSWVKDPVPSALARNGSVTVPGGILHFFYMPLTIGPVVMFYLFPAYVDVREVLSITGILMGHWTVGLIQPALLVHGAVHKQAILYTIGGCAALALAAVRLIYFV